MRQQRRVCGLLSKSSRSKTEARLQKELAMTGSCLCGKVRYEAEGELTAMHHCHCSRCRKHSGAAFVTDGFVAASGFRWLSGEGGRRCYRRPGWTSTWGVCGPGGPTRGGRDEPRPAVIVGH